VASLRARDLAVDIHELQDVLKEQIATAQKRYSDYANARRQPPPDFRIGSKAYVSAEFIRTTRPTRKLAEYYLGPFEIIGQPSAQSFTLRLPDELRSVHPVFHVSQLEPSIPNTIPNRQQDPPPPDFVDETGEHFEIDSILDSKIDKRRRCKLLYKVKWTGYEGTDEEDSWVSALDLADSRESVQAFHEQHPTRPGSYRQFLDCLTNAHIP